MSLIALTPEVFMDGHIQYLVKIDGVEAAFVRTLEEARHVISSLADVEEERLKKDNIRVYREVTQEAKKIVVCTRSVGVLYNGGLRKEMTFEIVPVGHAFFVKDKKSLRILEEMQTRACEILKREGAKEAHA